MLTAYDIAPDGDLSNRRVWAELDGAAPDGICVDAEGAVWFAEVPGRRCVRVREGGEVLQTITSELGCFACMLGGPDGTTLVTAAGWPDGNDLAPVQEILLRTVVSRVGPDKSVQPGMRPSSDSAQQLPHLGESNPRLARSNRSPSVPRPAPGVPVRSAGVCSAFVS